MARNIGGSTIVGGRTVRWATGVMALKDDVCGEFICTVSLTTYDRWALSAGGEKENQLLMLPHGVDGIRWVRICI
jgi:hypothetical protein